MARDDDEEDDRPRKRRSRDYDDDDDEPRPAKKKKKKPRRPMPTMLMVLAILALVWGGVWLLITGLGVLSALHNVYVVFTNPLAPLAAGMGFGFGKLSVILNLLVSLASLLFACAIVLGGILLLFRRAIGRNFIIGGPFGLVACLLVNLVILGFAGAPIGFLVGGALCGLLIHLGVAVLFLKLQENLELTRALR